MERYLLQVRLADGKRYDRLFHTYEDMKAYIMERSFFFIHADYSTYDLAIQLRGGVKCQK